MIVKETNIMDFMLYMDQDTPVKIYITILDKVYDHAVLREWLVNQIVFENNHEGRSNEAKFRSIAESLFVIYDGIQKVEIEYGKGKFIYTLDV